MLNDIEKDAKTRMQKSLDSLQHNLGKLRTGRAHPSLLDQISVDYYGTPTPLNQIASVTAQDPRMLLVTPWEKTMVAIVEKAILTSDLGLNPATSGSAIRVPMPALTEERRRDLSKVVKSEAENSKVAVRNIRRDANQSLKDLLKEKEITEDDERRGSDRIQKITNQFISEIDNAAEAKEQDLMAI